MRFASALVTIALCMPALHAQTTPAAASTGSSSMASLIQPSVASIQRAVSSVRVDKWKMPNELREETQANIGSITRDLDSTLPQLLTAADTQPAMLSRMLPAQRNLDALYNVLLRVAATAKVAAPGDQAAMLEDAVSQLQESRRAIETRMQETAVAQDKRVGDLQASLKASQDNLTKAKADAAAAAEAAKKPAKKSSRSTHKKTR